jgi:hypothetical protein
VHQHKQPVLFAADGFIEQLQVRAGESDLRSVLFNTAKLELVEFSLKGLFNWVFIGIDHQDAVKPMVLFQ